MGGLEKNSIVPVLLNEIIQDQFREVFMEIGDGFNALVKIREVIFSFGLCRLSLSSPNPIRTILMPNSCSSKQGADGYTATALTGMGCCRMLFNGFGCLPPYMPYCRWCNVWFRHHDADWP